MSPLQRDSSSTSTSTRPEPGESTREAPEDGENAFYKAHPDLRNSPEIERLAALRRNANGRRLMTYRADPFRLAELAEGAAPGQAGVHLVDFQIPDEDFATVGQTTLSEERSSYEGEDVDDPSEAHDAEDLFDIAEQDETEGASPRPRRRVSRSQIATPEDLALESLEPEPPSQATVLVRKAMAALPLSQQQLLEWHERTQEEIADELRVTQSTVSRRMKAARLAFVEEMELLEGLDEHLMRQRELLTRSPELRPS